MSGVSHGRIVARRVVALAALVAVLLVVLAIAKLDHSRGRAAATTAATTTLPPPPKPFRIVFPEGFTRLDMAQRVKVVAKIAQHERHKRPRLSRATYLAATGPRRIPGFGAAKRPLEGFLFPATYDFLKNTTSAQLVHMQLVAFARNWHKVDLTYARSKNLTPYDVLIIASMVERETVAPSERAKVAAVIYNRLRLRMPLGIDATIRYGLHIPGTEALHESQLQNPSPYNTRLHPGLPPTPIANPGLASIKAAAHPAHVDYLYYVRKPDKIHHYFTSSFDDFVNHEHLYGYK